MDKFMNVIDIGFYGNKIPASYLLLSLCRTPETAIDRNLSFSHFLVFINQKAMEKIIVQDTDRDILEILTVALEMDNFIVYPMMGFRDDFMGLIDLTRPHVVILDYALHGKRCIEVCQRIKQKYPHLPVIASSCNYNIHEEYNRLGFDDYIEKPFDLDVLYKILRAHIPVQEK